MADCIVASSSALTLGLKYSSLPHSSFLRQSPVLREDGRHSISTRLQIRPFRICSTMELSSNKFPSNLFLPSSFSTDTVTAAKKGSPPISPAVITPGGIVDLQSVLLRNRIILLGQTVNSQVAQRVISQLLMLATIDEEADIKMYINCPGGSTYSVLGIYDCMAWIKPKVSTICFGMAASQGALILAGGEKGMRFAMPNARIMIHQPQGGCGGTMEDVRRQVNEVVASRSKIDQMYAAFTGQPLEHVQMFTERDRFFSAAEAMEFGLIDGLLETEY